MGWTSRRWKESCGRVREFVLNNRAQFPSWFPADNAKDAFAASYPFHPTLLSYSSANGKRYPISADSGHLEAARTLGVPCISGGVQGAHKDALIGMGTAPLDDPMFRSAAFEH